MLLKEDLNNTIDIGEQTSPDAIVENKKVSDPRHKKKRETKLDASFEPTSPISPGAGVNVGLSFSLPSIKQGKKKNDHLDTFNPIVTSKQILEDCNCVNKANLKIKKLRKGEGKLISTGSKSIKEVYSFIFNKSQ